MTVRVGLIDVDGHNYPNLCLMKLSAHHKAQGHTVDWWNGFERYDLIYMSKVFTDLYSPDLPMPYNADAVFQGGTGYGLENRLPEEVEHRYPDYGLYPKYTAGTAYGFLTRGCPRACGFCIVAEKEGRASRQVAELSEFWRGQKKIDLLDPNLLACPQHEKLLETLAESRARVNFNQGLDARMLTPDNVRLLGRVNVRLIHFAWDNAEDDTVPLMLWHFAKHYPVKPRNVRVYVLTNYNTTHAEDLYRVERLGQMGYWPYVMVYDKPKAPQVTKDLQRFCNNGFIYWSGATFAEYRQKSK